jgi:hypothetical protein
VTALEGDVITAIFPGLVSFEAGDSSKWRPSARAIEEVDDMDIQYR